MLDKYFFLMLLISANTVGIHSDELEISYIQNMSEWSDEGIKEPVYANTSLVMTRVEANNWLVKDLNTNRNALLEILDSELVLKDKSDVRMEFDWIDFKEFQLKDRDSLFHAENNTGQFEIFRDRKQKIMQIRVLDEEKANKINNIQIQY